jgi:hypothetical protein
MSEMTRKSIYALLSAALLLVAGPRAARAQGTMPENRQTQFVVSEPTEIPGKVLEPGTYVIKVIDTNDEKEIVQFTNADQTKVVATVLAVRDYRVFPKGHHEFRFFQRAAGMPVALKTWFYPGDNWGEQFVYPKPRAYEIARASREKVAMTPSAASASLSNEVRQVTPEHKEMPLPPTAAAASPVSTEASNRAALPKTAGNMPLLALLSFLSVCGSLAAGRKARRSAGR